MSILSGFKKMKEYILQSDGYKLISRWTSSQTVEFDDGKTAQEKLGDINGIVKTADEIKTATDDSFVVSATAVKDIYTDLNNRVGYLETDDGGSGDIAVVTNRIDSLENWKELTDEQLDTVIADSGKITNEVKSLKNDLVSITNSYNKNWHITKYLLVGGLPIKCVELATGKVMNITDKLMKNTIYCKR